MARAEVVLFAEVRDKHTDRELLRGAAGLLGGFESRVPVRWMDYQLNVFFSAPAGVAGHVVARLAYAETDIWAQARDLTQGSKHRFFAVIRDGTFWILDWDDRAAPPVRKPDPQRFFAAGALSPDPAWDDIREERYSLAFREMREAPIHCCAQDPTAQVYRLLWLRRFEPEIVVNLTLESDGGGRLVTKENKGRDCTGWFVDEIESKVTPQETRRFFDALTAASFWTMPTQSGQIGADGEEWVLEGVAAGRHHVVTRWSPRKGVFEDAALELLALARIDPEAVRRRPPQPTVEVH